MNDSHRRHAPSPAGTRPQVVVVEDETIIAHDLQQTLEELGYGVPGVASDADAGLALVRNDEPDLVLIDIVLKGERSGIWLAHVLREEHHIPFVFVTSRADRQTVSRARETRPNGYLIKPFTKNSVFAAAEAALANYADEQHDIDYVAATGAEEQTRSLSRSCLRRVQEFVAKNLDRPISLSDLAEVADLNVYHFAHVFKDTVGVAPYQYVIKQRIEEAKRLLRHTDWPIAWVCQAVGYDNQSHFTTLFSREVGVPPGQYRTVQ